MNTPAYRPRRLRVVIAIGLLSLSRLVIADPLYDSFFSNNGSFEFGSASPPLTFSSSFSTDTTVTGWRLSAIGSTPQWLEGTASQDGNRYIELNSIGGLAGWHSGAQIVNGTASFVIGDIYTMNFWAAGGVGVQNQLDLGFTSAFGAEFFNIAVPSYTQSQFDALGGLDWHPYSVAFTATDATMNFNVFAHSFPTSGQNSSIYLDNFSIAAVPEPGSVVLVGLVGMMVVGTRRRRALAF